MIQLAFSFCVQEYVYNEKCTWMLSYSIDNYHDEATLVTSCLIVWCTGHYKWRKRFLHKGQIRAILDVVHMQIWKIRKQWWIAKGVLDIPSLEIECLEVWILLSCHLASCHPCTCHTIVLTRSIVICTSHTQNTSRLPTWLSTHVYYDIVETRHTSIRDNNWLMLTLHCLMKWTKYFFIVYLGQINTFGLDVECATLNVVGTM